MFMCLIFVGLLAIVVPQQAVAAGTISGTPITNNASIAYTVNTVVQTPVVDLSPPSFVVDNKVDLTVATSDGAAVAVSPGGQNQVLTFTVQNDGNTVQDYSLSAVAASGTWGGATDNFNAGNVEIYVETGGGAGYQAASDTATYIDELAPDASIAVYIIADIPLGQTNDDGALYDLVAQTAVGGTASTQGADITSDDSGDVDDPAVVQIVFADQANPVTGDTAEDGKYSSRDAYLVESAILTVDKTSTVISDPFNGTTNPKAIPGAIVEYTITITNDAGAGATATSVAVSDSLAVEIGAGRLAFEVDGYDTAKGIEVTTPDINGGAALELTNAADGDEGDFNITTANTVTVTGFALDAGESAIVKFRVQVQ